MKRYLCVLIAAMIVAMVPAIGEAQTKQNSKPRVERKASKKHVRSKKSTVKKDVSKTTENKVVKEEEIKTMDEPAASNKPRVIKEEVVLENPENQDTNIYKSVEQMPVFPGGEAALVRYLAQNINYPPEAAKEKIQGRVIVQFVVEKNGSIGEVKVVRSVDESLDREAVRVVKTLPKFAPGRQNGKAVAVWYTLPVSFKLTGDN